MSQLTLCTHFHPITKCTTTTTIISQVSYCFTFFKWHSFISSRINIWISDNSVELICLFQEPNSLIMRSLSLSASLANISQWPNINYFVLLHHYHSPLLYMWKPSEPTKKFFSSHNISSDQFNLTVWARRARGSRMWLFVMYNMRVVRNKKQKKCFNFSTQHQESVNYMKKELYQKKADIIHEIHVLYSIHFIWSKKIKI